MGVVAIDGTKVHANASQHATRNYEQIAREILAEADAVDAEEDEQFGEARGDELPPELATAQGRRGWLREAKRRLDDKRAEEARPIPRSRPERLKESKRRLEEEHDVECRANADYEAYRARGRMKDGRRFGRPPDPYQPPAKRRPGRSTSPIPTPATSRPRAAGCRATTPRPSAPSEQIVIAAEVTVDSPDFGHLEPMVAATEIELAAAGITARRRWCSPTPATGTRRRWRRSPAAEPWC